MATGSWVVGVLLTILGCFISNFGVTLQKLVHVRNAASGSVHANYAASWIWRGGLLLVIVGSLADLFALSFAPQSLVTPLGSLTLVSNIIYAPLLLKERIDFLSISATGVIITGSVVSVVFAPHKDPVYTATEIFALFTGTGFVLFALVLLAFLALLIYGANKCEEFEIAHGTDSPMYLKYRPIHQFTYPAASGIVGAQSVLFAKCTSSLVQRAIYHDEPVWGYFGFWFVFIMTFVCIFSQIKLLNDGLKRFDVVYEVPIFQAFWILISVLSGMALYKEHKVMSQTEIGLFSLGVLITLTGVTMLSYRKPTPRPTDVSSSGSTRGMETSEGIDLPRFTTSSDTRPRSRSRGHYSVLHDEVGDESVLGRGHSEVELPPLKSGGGPHTPPSRIPPLIPPPPQENQSPNTSSPSADPASSAVAYITSSIATVARGLGLASPDTHSELMGRELSVKEALSMGIALEPKRPGDSQWPSDIPRALPIPQSDFNRSSATGVNSNMVLSDAELAYAADDERVERKQSNSKTHAYDEATAIAMEDGMVTDAEGRIDRHPAHKMTGLSFASSTDALAAYGVASGRVNMSNLTSMRLPPPPETPQQVE